MREHDTGPATPGRQPISLRYVLEPADFKPLYAGHAKAMQLARAKAGAKSGWLVKAAWFVFVFLVAFSYFPLRDAGYLPELPLLPFVAGVSSVILLTAAWWLFIGRAAYLKNSLIANGLDRAEIETVVGPDGLSTSRQFSTGFYEWPAVMKLDDMEGHFVFWVSGMMAVIVPKRAFADAAAMQDFAVAVKEWSHGKAA